MLRQELVPKDFALVAEWREPSGFAPFIRHSPDGPRRSADKLSAIGLTPHLKNEKTPAGRYVQPRLL